MPLHFLKINRSKFI